MREGTLLKPPQELGPVVKICDLVLNICAGEFSAHLNYGKLTCCSGWGAKSILRPVVSDF
ncbi:hypothetical protein BDR07DRAFT_1392050 [Suillus spraguei]|nr:hypothetical protein BDR07DRAFT_1406425 [Suillus spraguei]KAG2367934.1 hypothetical protein BDR07DRAFT_1392050 [Suillus spraguei]